VRRDIKADLLLASISGGTDIIACFMGENSVLPVHKGEIQSAHLGCSIQVVILIPSSLNRSFCLFKAPGY
jgi:acetoacetyl-CoA synthetase